MGELIQNWTIIITAVTAFILAFIKLLEVLEILVKRLPKPLKEFLVCGLAIVIPYAAIIWWFFYLAGLSPHRLSEPKFFWAVVAQPTAGTSIYTYIWGKRIYPRLQQILGGTDPVKQVEAAIPQQDAEKPRALEKQVRATRKKG